MKMLKVKDTENLKSSKRSPVQVAQLVGASSRTPKGCGFDSQSGHIPRLQVQSPVTVSTAGCRSMFLSHIHVSLSLPSSFSKMNNKISSGEDKNNKNKSKNQCLFTADLCLLSPCPGPAHPSHNALWATAHTAKPLLEGGPLGPLCRSGTILGQEKRDWRSPDPIQEVLKRKNFKSEDTQE